MGVNEIMNSNCYYSSEALYHILGGKKAGWKPMVMKIPVDLGRSHWFLKHKSGMIMDISKKQFKGTGFKPDYTKAKGCGFLTKKPSFYAKELIHNLTWFVED